MRDMIELLKVDTIDDARQKLLEKLTFDLKKTEILPLWEANDRILAVDVLAEENIPAFHRSSVDGYAVRAADTHGATESIPAFLDLLEDVAIGTGTRKVVTPGTCSYVPTGGMIPEGADAMVMVEYTEMLDEMTVAINTSVPEGASIVRCGEDAARGSRILPKGSRLGPAEIGSLAAAGVSRVEVICPLKVWILSTGDELVEPGSPLAPGQVYDINTWALKAAAEKMGLWVLGQEHLPDDHDRIRDAVAHAMEVADLVFTSGGSSKGKKDMTSTILGELASPGVFVHGLAVKPGKPTILAVDEASKTLLVGLPGHPAAALMVFGQMIGWLWRQLTGEKEKILTWAPMDVNMASAPGKTTCQLVELVDREAGQVVRPIFAKSGLITPLTRAHGYICIDRNSEGLKKGEMVAVYPL